MSAANRREPRIDAQWLSGFHSVLETLRGKPGSAKELLVAAGSKGAEVDELMRLAREAGARVRYVDRRELDRVAARAATRAWLCSRPCRKESP